jgi:sporulation protein YlmC with PRC-barrel domain
VTSISSIEGRAVYDESANKVGTAKQVGIDSTQSMVLIITQNDGSEGSITWKNIKKVGEVILLGNPEDASQPGKCSNCGFGNKEGSKFCEDCGTAI